jgi:protein-disulfide isomerase
MSVNKNPDKGTRNLVIGMVAFIVLVGAIFSFISNKSSTTAKIPAAVSANDGYGVVLNPNATPRLDIYLDYQCPICKNFEIINGGYISEIAASGKAKVVVHPMTFIGAESILAANAAACAADEGKFLDMNMALFQNQSGSENSGLWTGDYMKRLGNSIGLKSKSFENCVTDGTYVDWTKNVAKASADANVNSTPTVKINGKEIYRKKTNSDPKDEYMDPVQFKAALAAAGVK